MLALQAWATTPIVNKVMQLGNITFSPAERGVEPKFSQMLDDLSSHRVISPHNFLCICSQMTATRFSMELLQAWNGESIFSVNSCRKFVKFFSMEEVYRLCNEQQSVSMVCVLDQVLAEQWIAMIYWIWVIVETHNSIIKPSYATTPCNIVMPVTLIHLPTGLLWK